MHNQLVFNGKELGDFGVDIRGDSTYKSPERDVETVSIPGRDGDLLIDNGRYKNVTITYPAYILRKFREPSYFDAMRAFMLANTGYQRLEDSFHPEEYRIARLNSAISPDVYDKAKTGEFELEFDCKPQRFLKRGERTKTFTENGVLINDTLFSSKPLIRAYGTGTFYIGNYGVSISAADVYTDIDSDIMDCFKGSANKNAYVSMNSFPLLAPGSNGITLGTLSRIDIIPRWFTL